MKKALIHILPIALILGSCTHLETPVIENSSISGDTFCVYLSDIQTKTINDGMSTKWVEGDNIQLFHAVSGTANYVDDHLFACDNVVANKFSGTLAEELDGNASYDWYASYPLLSNSQKPNDCNLYIGRTEMASFAGKVTQNGNNSMAHLAGGKAGFPIAGYAKAVAAVDYPTISMINVASVIDVNVKNALDDNIVVKSINLVASKPIIGQFNFDLTNEDFKAIDSGNSQKIIQLEVQDGTAISKGESAKFYIGVAPFTAEAGSEFLLYLNVQIGDNLITQRLVKTVSEDISFKSGHIKTFNADYSQMDNSLPVNVNKADFQTLNIGNTSTAFKAGSEHFSFDGWRLETGAVIGSRQAAMVSRDLAAVICGGTSQTGVLTSPLIADGCGTLKFNYGVYNNSEKIKFRIDVKNNSGEVIKTETVENLEPVSNIAYEFSKDFNVSGAFQLEFTNLCPSGVANRKDRVAIFNVEWTRFQ